MYASIDNLVDKLDRQLVRRKEKNESQRTDIVQGIPDQGNLNQ
jgi:putative sigma-54 modulation protein